MQIKLFLESWVIDDFTLWSNFLDFDDDGKSKREWLKEFLYNPYIIKIKLQIGSKKNRQSVHKTLTDCKM